jgi:CheY-like chemotaxis protein
MDGYEAATAIQLPPVPHRAIPIIALTASAMEGNREKCLQAGMNDCVSKPVRKEDLEQILLGQPFSSRLTCRTSRSSTRRGETILRPG